MPHLLIVTADFYTDIATHLQAGAKAALTAAKASFELISVPGALEIPIAIKMGIESGKFDGYVALGCVIRGETSHYDIVAGESARGLMELGITHAAAIGNGILTVETRGQALKRAKVNQGNKGAHAAEAALSLIALQANSWAPL